MGNLVKKPVLGGSWLGAGGSWLGAGGCGWILAGCGWVQVGADGCGWVQVGAGGSPIHKQPLSSEFVYWCICALLLKAVPTRIQQDPAGPSRTQQDPAGPTRTQQDPAGPSRTHQDPPGPTRTQQDPAGPSRTQQDPAGPSHFIAIFRGKKLFLTKKRWFLSGRIPIGWKMIKDYIFSALQQ